ncbi:MAG: sodium pump decarboxylase gamma subunit [Epulopiscium sp.]|nr:sodium pump decarboxylase gamma subunit [Candidatus Epulonipiscium sp.]
MFDNFILSLNIMWKGMLGIFVVILLITFVVIILSKIPVDDSKI